MEKNIRIKEKKIMLLSPYSIIGCCEKKMKSMKNTQTSSYYKRNLRYNNFIIIPLL